MIDKLRGRRLQKFVEYFISSCVQGCFDSMVEYFKDVLLNVFLSCSPLVLYPYLIKTQNNVHLYRFLVYLVFSAALIVTMFFPITTTGLVYDFRSVPLTLGSVYGGVPVMLMLFTSLGVFRYLTGVNGLFFVMAILPALSLFLFTIKRYRTFTLFQKISYAVIASALLKLIAYPIYLSFTDQLYLLFLEPLATLETYVIQAVLIAGCVYLMEHSHRYARLQDEIAVSAKMKIVADMAASVAHEIRNPLTAVRGFIQLLGADQQTPERRDYYKRICLEELDNAQNIIADYLSLADSTPVKWERMNVLMEISHVAEILRTYSEKAEIRLHVEEDLFVLGDRFKLRQALVNIGKNGLEAMAFTGTLQFVSIRVNESVLIKIMDTGIGMTQEQITRLGTPYYSTKEKGTGLGMTFTFGVVSKMNGSIDIRSAVGKGTEYRIILPYAEPDTFCLKTRGGREEE